MSATIGSIGTRLAGANGRRGGGIRNSTMPGAVKRRWLRFLSLLLGLSLLHVGASSAESALVRGKKLSASGKTANLVKALGLLRTRKGVGHIDKERALYLYGQVCLQLRVTHPQALSEATQAFNSLAKNGRFEGMRWRGEIGNWSVRLITLSKAKEAANGKTKPSAKRAALERDVQLALERQNAREWGIDIAFFLGQLREQSAQRNSALSAYRHCLKLWDNLAKRRKRYSAAVDDYLGFLSRNDICAAVKRLDKPKKAKEPERTYNRARRLQWQGKCAEAQKLFDGLSKRHASHVLGAASQFRAAECAQAMKKYAQCRERLQRFLEESPTGSYRGHAHLLLGDLLALLGFDLDAGSREYRAVLKPDGWRAWWPRKTTKRVGKNQTPDETWNAARYKAHERLGVIAYFERKYDKAAACFKLSHKLRPKRENWKYGGNPVGMELVVELVQAKRLPQVISADVLQGDRRVAFGLFWAAVLREGWRHAEALEVLKRIEQHLAKSASADQQAFIVVRKGDSYQSLGHKKEATACYRQFVSGKWKRSRWGAEACLLYANMLSSENKKTEADKYLKMSFTQFPNGRWADYALYQWALFKSWDPKKKQEALRWLKHALTQYPNSDYAPVAKAVVTSLQKDTSAEEKK